MRKLLVSTTALSVAFSPLGTMPSFAQVMAEDGSVTGPDGTVLCIPTDEAPCDLEAIIEALKVAEAEAAAAKAAADLEAALEAEAAAAAEAEAAAAAEAAAQAEAEAAAAAAELEAAMQAEAAAQAEAEAAAAADAAAAEAAAAEAAAAEAAAAEAAAADAAAAEAAAAEAAAEAAAAEAAAAEAAQAEAQAEAEAATEAAAEAADQAEADAEAEAAAAAAAEAEAAAVAEAEAAAAAEAEAAAAAEAEAAAAAEAEAAAAAEAEAAAEAATEAPTEAEPATEAEIIEEPTEFPFAEVPDEPVLSATTGELLAPEAVAEALAEAKSEIKMDEDGTIIDPAAGLRTADPEPEETSEPVDIPEVSEAEVESLTQLLTMEPNAIDPEASVAAASLTRQDPEEGEAVTLVTPAAEDLIADVTEVITERDVRNSAEEFNAAPTEVSEGKKDKLSNLEKAGLLVLGALVVGAIIKSNNQEEEQEVRQVVSNTGDRVIVLRPDGTYQVLKDDDTVIREPGSTVRTETFRDGSTRTIVERTDGTQVVTIRDATGRVLRRATYDSLGRELVLIDDLAREEVVVVRDLPRPGKRIVISSMDSDTALKRELATIEADRAGRKFSLRQIRDIPEVRALAAVIDVPNVTFASGSSAIAATEARNLADLGRVMQNLLELNPGEIFLIEGHTDATGSAALNLVLSDRRAESMALALSEYFDIPPENMVVQGYGETELLVDTELNEPRNRRVEVRVITPLMRTAELR